MNDEKDAAAAALLAALYLDNDTLLYEIGCWNGQNLFNLSFYTFLQEKPQNTV
ncbi:hypothetical protein PHSC3_002024 [Chlamydiales bacterium STE3]|nr:hypothetical protein PHSC3_002024 [Chlamydiales bacterium STE3]